MSVKSLHMNTVKILSKKKKQTNSLLLHQLNFLAFYHSMNHEYFNSEFFPFLLHWSTAFKHWPGFVPTPMLASHIFLLLLFI